MSTNGESVGLFVLPQEFPCGKESTCCGPVGQTAEEIAALQAALEGLGVEVVVHNVKDPVIIQEHPNVSTLLRSAGMSTAPICTVGGQVVCMGSPAVEEVVSAVREKLVSP